MLSIITTPPLRRGRARPCALLAALAFTFAFAFVYSTVRAQDAAVTLDAALQAAAERNTTIQAAQASVDASADAALRAGQLPNPTLMAGVDNLPVNGSRAFTIGQDILTMRRIGIEQEWVSSRKRRLRSDLAGEEVERERSGYLGQLAKVREQTATAWLNAAYAKRAIVLQQALLDHMNHELAATQASYRGARATAADVVQAQAMLAQANDDLLKARQVFQTALIGLSRWTASPVTDVAGDPPAPQSVVSSLPPEQLRDVQPILIAASADIRVADADSAVAHSNRSSNWTWNVSYLQGGGNSRFMSVGVSVPLPINRKNVEDREESAKAELATKARLIYEDTQRQVESDIRALSATLASGRERIAGLQQTLLPAADQRVSLATAAWQAGAGSLADTFAAQRAQLDAQLQVLGLQRDVSLVWAQLEYQVVPPRPSASQ